MTQSKWWSRPRPEEWISDLSGRRWRPSFPSPPRKRGCRHGVEPRSYSHRRHAPATVGYDPPIEAARQRILTRPITWSSKTWNPALPHLEDEVEVILARLSCTQSTWSNSKSRQLPRGQSLMRKSRTTDQHGSQFTYFRMNTELPFHGESARKDLRSFQGEPCALIYVKARLR